MQLLRYLCALHVQDVVNEAVKWGGKVLLHQEVAIPAAMRSAGAGFWHTSRW
jgi:hypothetical protein